MNNEFQLKKISTRKYFFAVTTLFLVFAALLFIQKKIIKSQQKYAHLINISGRQRMLSQKISLLVYEIKTSRNSVQIEQSKKDYLEARNEFISAQKFLSPKNNELTPLTFEYFQLVESALQNKENLLSMSNFAKNKLLPKLNAVVLKYENESDSINALQQRFLLVVLFILTALIIIGTVFIFNPLQKLYHRTFYQFKEAMENLELERLKAIQASKMATLGEMAGGIAHEINNPLTVIQGLALLLKRQVKENAVVPLSLGSTLEKIELMTVRISKIIKSLSAFSRAGDHDPLTEVSLKKIIEETLDLCIDRFHHQNIALEVDMKTDFTILCREVQVSQVLINLLNNSHDAIQDHSEKWIKLHITESDYSIHVVVTDSGKGISRELGKKIMQPFFTTKEKGKGTGLGLSISKGIMKEHLGQLEINYQSTNTQFVIKFPKKETFCFYEIENHSVEEFREL